jgi:MerR family copper efflux transcriptional regulator
MAGLLIGDVAERTGLTAPTIRYYESIGLLAPAPRSATGYRRYSQTTVEELRFIRKAQSLGFSLEEIGEILTLSRAGDTPCSHVLDLSRRHLRAVEDRIQQLTRFHDQLAAELAKWNGKEEPTCRGLCQIITSAEEQETDPPSVDLHAQGAPAATRRKSRK